ncbi:hypothetical protein [Mangrovicella endophytica]|uniref:hypothetical protein n=1 Tax=Mangrovicella endophytica TaxID=2066697 RepID=UPI000C9DA886|nr:hypothetical protein [Mangrovicella endophytica]
MKRLPYLAMIMAIAITAPALAEEFEKAGSQLQLGETATVPHLVPKGPEVPIELKVTAIEEGSADDLKGFEVPAELANARPFYVRYEYTNASGEDLSAQQVGAFVAIDDRDQVHSPALAMSGGSFNKCTTKPAASLTPGKTHEGCVMFMIHENGRIVAAAYKGHYRDEAGVDTQKAFPIYYNPIRWAAAKAPGDGPTARKGVIIQ